MRSKSIKILKKKKKKRGIRSRITFLQTIKECQKGHVYRADGNMFSSVETNTGGGACQRGDGVC